MKNLRRVRNVAALFILAMAVLPARPAAASRKCVFWGCVSAPGYVCESDSSTCSSHKCTDKKDCPSQTCQCLI
jgi:hypothetical protein